MTSSGKLYIVYSNKRERERHIGKRNCKNDSEDTANFQKIMPRTLYTLP